jgi:hypothetical protein
VKDNLEVLCVACHATEHYNERLKDSRGRFV